MAKWEYRVLVADDEAGLRTAATRGLGADGAPFEIMMSTVKGFQRLDSNDTGLGDIGGIRVDNEGLVALARRETP